MTSVLLILLSVTLAIGGQFLLKTGMNRVGRIGGGDLAYYQAMLLKTFVNPYVLVGLTLYVLSSVSWLVVLSRVDLSYAYPFGAVGYVVSMLIAWRFLSEPVSVVRMVGALFICVGVVFISRS